MNGSDDEIRRLQRLRDEQLRARDPTAKGRARQQSVAARYRRSRKRTTVWNIVSDFPAKWRYMLVGLLLGLLVALTINIIVQETWAQVVGGVVVVFGLVAGRLMGAVKDWGNEDWGRKR